MRILRAIVGPTASGKTSLALELARRLPIEIVSCDSQAVYRHLDIGTAKPSAEERAQVPHHLIDVADPWEDFSAARFVEEAEAAIAEIEGRGKLPILVGGTGLYLRSLLHGIFEGPPKDEGVREELVERIRVEGNQRLHDELRQVDPAAAARIEIADAFRIVRALEVYRLSGEPISVLQARHAAEPPRYAPRFVGISPSRDELYRRVNARGAAMFEEGLVEEAVRLGQDPRIRPRLERIMGYRQALALAEGELDREAAIRETQKEQRHYAKRQLTWFRAMPDVEWLPWPPDIDEVVTRF